MRGNNKRELRQRVLIKLISWLFFFFTFSYLYVLYPRTNNSGFRDNEVERRSNRGNKIRGSSVVCQERCLRYSTVMGFVLLTREK